MTGKASGYLFGNKQCDASQLPSAHRDPGPLIHLWKAAEKHLFSSTFFYQTTKSFWICPYPKHEINPFTLQGSVTPRLANHVPCLNQKFRPLKRSRPLGEKCELPHSSMSMICNCCTQQLLPLKLPFLGLVPWLGVWVCPLQSPSSQPVSWGH